VNARGVQALLVLLLALLLLCAGISVGRRVEACLQRAADGLFREAL